MTVTHYPFEMFATLRRDVATLTHAWDNGQLSEADKKLLRFALELVDAPCPTSERVAMIMAIVGSVADGGDVR